MNKKIMSLFFLLIILVSVVLVYSYLSQESSDDIRYSGSPDTITDSDINGEIDNIFLEENDEVEIGEMI